MPLNYDDCPKDWYKNGYRVISLAYKKLEDNNNIQNEREFYETDLEFLGFIILRNNVREGTEKLLKQIKNSNKISKMLTGDNIDTAITCAIKC